MHKHYNGPWICFKKVPLDTKKAWFQDFQMVFFWDGSLTYEIYAVWKAKCSDHLRNIFGKARKHGRQPNWISDENWALMLKTWKEDSDFNHQSDVNKINHASIPVNGTAGYIGGSIPWGKHRKKLTEIHKRPPTMEEMMQATFQKKSGEWSGTRVVEAMNCYKKLKAANPDAIGEDDIALWVQAVGGPKNKKVFALGSYRVAGISMVADHPFINQSSSSSVVKEKDSRVEKLEEVVAAMKDVIEGLRSEIHILSTQQAGVQPSYQHFQTNSSMHIPVVGPTMQLPIPSSHPSHAQTYQGGSDENADHMSFTHLLNSSHHGQASIRPAMFGATSASAITGMPSSAPASTFVGFPFHSSGFQASTSQAPTLFRAPMYESRNMSAGYCATYGGVSGGSGRFGGGGGSGRSSGGSGSFEGSRGYGDSNNSRAFGGSGRQEN